MLLPPTQYGRPDNSSCPGETLTKAQFRSNTSSTLHHVLADRLDLFELHLPLEQLKHRARDVQWVDHVGPVAGAGGPILLRKQHRVDVLQVQQLRCFELPNTTVMPLPTDIDMALLSCLNATIGDGVPLVDAAVAGSSASVLASKVRTLGLAWIIMCIVKTFILCSVLSDLCSVSDIRVLVCSVGQICIAFENAIMVMIYFSLLTKFSSGDYNVAHQRSVHKVSRSVQSVPPLGIALPTSVTAIQSSTPYAVRNAPCLVPDINSVKVRMTPCLFTSSLKDEYLACWFAPGHCLACVHYL